MIESFLISVLLAAVIGGAMFGLGYLVASVVDEISARVTKRRIRKKMLAPYLKYIEQSSEKYRH